MQGHGQNIITGCQIISGSSSLSSQLGENDPALAAKNLANWPSSNGGSFCWKIRTGILLGKIFEQRTGRFISQLFLADFFYIESIPVVFTTNTAISFKGIFLLNTIPSLGHFPTKFFLPDSNENFRNIVWSIFWKYWRNFQFLKKVKGWSY